MQQGEVLLIIMIPSQVRLLVEIENSLPKFILKRVQVYSHTEFPNQSKTLKQVVCERDSIHRSHAKAYIPKGTGDWGRVNYVAVTVMWASLRFGYSHFQTMGIPLNPNLNPNPNPKGNMKTGCPFHCNFATPTL